MRCVYTAGAASWCILRCWPRLNTHLPQGKTRISGATQGATGRTRIRVRRCQLTLGSEGQELICSIALHMSTQRPARMIQQSFARRNIRAGLWPNG